MAVSSQMAYAGGEWWDKVKGGASEVIDQSAEVLTQSKEAIAQVIGKKTSRDIRKESDFAVNLSFAPLNLPFPMAWGMNASYIASEKWMFGIDYLNSGKALKFFSFEIGAVEEQNYTLQVRRFYGNSFNVKMGIGQRTSEVRLAKDLFDLVETDYSGTVSKLKTNYFRFGLGNQWQFKDKYTFVVDWISINIPFSGEVETSASQFAKTDDDKKEIEDAENILKFYPSGALFHMEIGLIF